MEREAKLHWHDAASLLLRPAQPSALAAAAALQTWPEMRRKVTSKRFSGLHRSHRAEDACGHAVMSLSIRCCLDSSTEQADWSAV